MSKRLKEQVEEYQLKHLEIKQRLEDVLVRLAVLHDDVVSILDDAETLKDIQEANGIETDSVTKTRREYGRFKLSTGMLADEQ